jgi:hypothetical protein
VLGSGVLLRVGPGIDWGTVDPGGLLSSVVLSGSRDGCWVEGTPAPDAISTRLRRPGSRVEGTGFGWELHNGSPPRVLDTPSVPVGFVAVFAVDIEVVLGSAWTLDAEGSPPRLVESL